MSNHDIESLQRELQSLREMKPRRTTPDVALEHFIADLRESFTPEIHVDMPQVPPPEVRVEVAAPEVTVQAPPAPPPAEVRVNVPDQSAALLMLAEALQEVAGMMRDHMLMQPRKTVKFERNQMGQIVSATVTEE